MTGPLMRIFEPKGDRPEWKIIYDELLAGAEFGTIISYEQLDHVLGREFITNRSPMYRARRHLGEMRQRWMEPVNKAGYRVIEAREHMDAAQQRKRRAKRQLQTMVDIATYTDLGRLTPEELVAFDSQSKINQALAAVALHHERRLRRIEQILQNEGML